MNLVSQFVIGNLSVLTRSISNRIVPGGHLDVHKDSQQKLHAVVRSLRERNDEITAGLQVEELCLFRVATLLTPYVTLDALRPVVTVHQLLVVPCLLMVRVRLELQYE